MQTMYFYLIVALKLGFLDFSSAAPLWLSVEKATKHVEIVNSLDLIGLEVIPAPKLLSRATRSPVTETQKAYYMKITESLVNGTVEPTNRPRCGVVDHEDFSFFSGKPKFERNDLTYRVNQYTNDLSQDVVNDVLMQAFKLWSDVTPLTFIKSTSVADIEITFASRAHGDGFPFDGASGILAHAFAPESGIGGDAHFDEDETWTTGSNGINLFLVAAHEFGRSLGLDHSDDENALMFPFYRFVNTDGYTLPNDDVQGIQTLYGSQYWSFRRTRLRPGYPKPISDLGFPSSFKKIDAAMRIRYGRIVFFVGDQLWRYNPRRNRMLRGYPRSISELFPEISNNVDAAFAYRRRYYLTSGPLVYKYWRNLSLVASFEPKGWMDCE